LIPSEHECECFYLEDCDHWPGTIPCHFECGAMATVRYIKHYLTCLACAQAGRCLGVFSAKPCGAPATMTRSALPEDSWPKPLCQACADTLDRARQAYQEQVALARARGEERFF
jgi:hypothetical protein